VFDPRADLEWYGFINNMECPILYFYLYQLDIEEATKYRNCSRNPFVQSGRRMQNY
jgi:hypothetical protein